MRNAGPRKKERKKGLEELKKMRLCLSSELLLTLLRDKSEPNRNVIFCDQKQISTLQLLGVVTGLDLKARIRPTSTDAIKKHRRLVWSTTIHFPPDITLLPSGYKLNQ